MDNEFLDISNSLGLQVGYGIGHILNDVCASLWFTYFLVFFHFVLEFTAAQAGYLMLIGQIVDALFTPFIGYFSDHTNNSLSARYGRRKVWHFFGTVCVLSSFPFIFIHCIGCSMTHKWAQMFYFAAFITIFQIGWAAVQISHLSLIPELAEDPHVRTHLTAIRYGFTVFSNLFVYVITWIILHLSGQCDKEQVGPADAYKFKQIMSIVLIVGTVASVIFHTTVTEKQPRSQILSSDFGSSTLHCDIFRKSLLYHVAGIYMSTRLVVNISQVLMPLFLHRTLGLPAQTLAVVPLTMYLGSLASAGFQRLAPRSFTRKLSYLLGSAFALGGFLWLYDLDSSHTYKVNFIYVVAILIGFGGAQMLVTSLSLTADLVGGSTDASAFVYGLMSFSDKLSCGAAIAVIQMYADNADTTYYRNVLSWVCGAATILGLVLTLILPRVTHDSLIINSNPIIDNEEQVSTPSHISES